MGIASIAAGVLSLLFMVGGVVATPVPILGLMLSFLAPVLALVGIVLGGIGMSRAKQAGEESGPALGGLIVSLIAVIPALVVALTCGVCNSMCTSGYIQNAANPRPSSGSFRFVVDGGVLQIVPQGQQNAPGPMFPPPSTYPPPNPNPNPNGVPDPNAQPNNIPPPPPPP